MAKKKAKKAQKFDRIEIQAKPDWVKLLDEAAKTLGVSRSDYIRMAVSRQMAIDQRK